MIRCVVYHNDEAIKTYELNEEVITIGRLPENTISIANMGISRRHARIERLPDRNYVVMDLNSLNGTYVNNRKAKKSVLTSGDMIAIGKFTVLFELLSSDDSAAAASTVAAPAESRSDVQGLPEVQEEISSDTDTPPEAPTPQPGSHSSAVLIETNKHVVYRLDKAIMTIGNSEEDDIFVAGFLIGDGHVIVEHKDDGHWIGAQKLMGRFKVNGKKVSTHHLEHKDRIEIGNSTFRYMENG